MKALVTGSTGLTGRSLLPLLNAQGVEVVPVTVRGARDGLEAADFQDLDAVAELLAREKPELVFHLSGALAADDSAEMVAANCLHAATLLEAVLRTGIDTRVLIVGSAAEYGPVAPGDLPVREEHVCRPASLYGASKLAQTRLALGARGVRTVVARPSNIIGAGMPASLALGRFAAQLARIAAGEAEPVLKTGALDAVRDFIDVADVVEAYWRLINAPRAFGAVVNVASGTGVTIGHALDRLIGAFGLNVDVVPQDVEHGRSGGTAAFVASRDRLDGLVGRWPLVPLEESMERIAAHARREAVSLEGSS